MNANIICHLIELLPMPKNIKSCVGLTHSWIQAKPSVLGSTATKAAPWWEKSSPHASSCGRHSTASTQPSSCTWLLDKAAANSLAFSALLK